MNAVVYRLLIAPIAVFATAAFSSISTAQAFEPAAFIDSQEHLEQAVTPPPLAAAQPVVSVYCQADVSTAGKTSNVICYEKDGFDQARDQTAAAMDGQQVRPAKVDGRAVPVRMEFRVVYANIEGQAPVLLLPNLGNMQNTYGFYYTGPQERLDVDPWYESYSANDWAEGRMFFSGEGRPTRFVAVVDEKGEPIAVRRIQASKRNKRDAVELEKQLQETRFIPGFADGKPVRTQYVAALHYPN